MKFEDSKYSELLDYKKVEFSFGTIYATKNFLLPEINEEVHIDYDIAVELISQFGHYITEGAKMGYITTRFNSYSIDLQLWTDFNNDYDVFVASAVVTYSDFSYLNASLEKQFFGKSLKRCSSLEEAIEWIMNLKEFQDDANQN